MGGLGIRLMLKCVDGIEYEHEGAKIALTKFKKPAEPEFAQEKELTPEEQVYKNTLWDEIEKTETKTPQPVGRAGVPEAQPASAGDVLPLEPPVSTRPEERMKRFEDRLSQFFIRDPREGLKILSGEDAAKEMEKGKKTDAAFEDADAELRINIPDYIKADDTVLPAPPADEDKDLDLDI